uniref:Ras-GEF domain-containing protein n=1 Tax=Arcella intermedia TaxID=1963864 RepID=A0A6B2L5P8_9EUKA
MTDLKPKLNISVIQSTVDDEENFDGDLSRPGSLDFLILVLTSRKHMVKPENFNTFISGYELFTNASVVWSKILERYMKNYTNLPVADNNFVKLRSAKTILEWIRKDPHSIDLGTLHQIELFANTTLSQDLKSISTMIIKELESLNKFSVEIPAVPNEMKFYEDPLRLFYVEKKTTIAEQMTLIDFEIYGKICYTELTDLKWSESKEKLHVFARNTISFIKRSNFLALFTATTILLQKKLKDRINVLTRFIGIAKCLADLNNYNSLMGIIVGLGQASISRLKLTWSRVPSKDLEIYKNLQQFFSPGNAFKLLREKLKAAGTNALPYLGCILGDLTFMDEGNPNFIMEENTKLINFPKHQLINRSITELQQYQKPKFAFHPQEPLYTLLQQLPALTDRELFSLCLEREPKQPNPI